MLELGCGVGMLGIYLACLGSNVLMSDVSVLKDLVERNININRKMLKGNPEFVVINWYQDVNIGKMIAMEVFVTKEMLCNKNLNNFILNMSLTCLDRLILQ